MDLNTRDTRTAAERGIVVELEDPITGQPFLDDDGTPFSITILGGDAAVVRTKARKQLDRYITLIRKNQDPGNAESGEADNIDRLATATIAWHLPLLDGVELVLPTEDRTRIAAATKLYSDPRFLWIAELLTRAMSDRARFFAQSSTS